MRDHQVLLWASMAVGIVGLGVAGLWDWSPWLRLAAVGVLGVICTRVFAPMYYGWREPEEHAARRTRR